MPAAAAGVLAPGAADNILRTGAAPIVRLVAAGAEPRASLAYAFVQGEKQPLEVALDVQMAMATGERSMPKAAVPRMAMTLDLSVVDVDPAGEAHVDAGLRGLDVVAANPSQQAIATEMRAHLDTMRGLSMSYRITPQGAVREVHVSLPDSAPPAAQQTLASMSQSFESMVAPLPKEPIGVGAEWEVVSRVQSSGADILQYATYTLRSRQGGVAKLDVVERQLAASDRVKAPGMPDGVVATLRSFASSGKGTTEIDTGQIAPRSGTLALSSAMTIEVSGGMAGAGGEKQSLRIDTTLGVTFSRPSP